MSERRPRPGDIDEPDTIEIIALPTPRGVLKSAEGNQIMNDTFDSAAEKFSPGNHPGDRHQNEVASATSSWNENLKDNLFIVLLVTAAISFLAGYFISQQQEARKRDQWAEILFRQAKHWFADRGRKTAESVEQGLDYALRPLKRPWTREQSTVTH
jgi:hypothetical protein